MKTPPRLHPTRSLRSPRSGFTLVELLTVIAIVGILAGILIPVVGKVRASARQSTCASNMRQFSIALAGYTTEHRGQLPGYEKIKDNTGTYYDMGREVNPRWWIEGGNLTRGLTAQLLPYLTDTIHWNLGTGIADVAVCPANAGTKDSITTTSPAPSYMLGIRVKTTANTLQRPFAYGGKPSLTLNDIAVPGSAVLFFDIDTAFASLLGTSTSAKGSPTSAHGSTRNVLYFDGHIAAVPHDINPHETL